MLSHESGHGFLQWLKEGLFGTNLVITSVSMLGKAMEKLHRDVAGGRSLISIAAELNWHGAR